jgi:di/tricarboxylate transporter
VSWQIVVTLALLAAAVVLFASERLRVDLVALLMMTTLMVLGIVSPEDGLAGFANPATVTVASMFVLSAGLLRTGALDRLGDLFTVLAKRHLLLAVAAIMAVIAPLSAFINNTAAVAIFLPVVLAVSRDSGVSASKLLIPLSFASMLGGVCTLIGTSTNVLVSSIAAAHGEEPFGMFEMAPLGLVFLAVGSLYLLTVGVRLLPARRTAAADLTESFGMGDYLTEIELTAEAESVGHGLADSPLVRDLDLDVLQVVRDGRSLGLPTGDTVLAAGDLLRVRCDADCVRALGERPGVGLRPRRKWTDRVLEGEELVLVEAVVLPNTRLDGGTLAGTRFRNVFGATVLALRHRDRLIHEAMSRQRLAAGDTLLLELPRQRLAQVRALPDLAVISEAAQRPLRRRRTLAAVAILAAVVATAASGLLPVAVAAAAGAVLMVLARVLSLEEAYEAMDWKVVFLLAGVLALGAALETTGAASLLSDGLLRTAGGLGAMAVVAAFYLLTSLLTETMSNNATAAVLAPVALVTADTLGVDPRPLLMAVTFAASASFMTPVGYQTNLLVYGPGQYRFADFLRVGTPLNLVFWVLATLLIPRFWPL